MTGTSEATSPTGPAPTTVVTGTGFIASHLVRRLQADGAKVAVVTRRPGDFGDLTITGALTGLSSQVWDDAGVERIGTLFHLAAATPKSGAQANDIDAAYAGNLDATRVLLESVAGRVSRVVYTSTLDVYGTLGPEPVDEDAPTRPASLYGAAKLFCESLVRQWAHTEGCEHAIVRLGHIYGAGEEQYRKLIPETIRRLLAGEAPLVYGDGRATTDLLHVSDVVEALVRAGEAGRAVHDPLNVVGPSSPIGEIVALLAELFDKSDDIEHVPGLATAPMICFDDRRMQASLGSWPRVALEAGLRDEVDHMRAHTEDPH